MITSGQLIQTSNSTMGQIFWQWLWVIKSPCLVSDKESCFCSTSWTFSRVQGVHAEVMPHPVVPMSWAASSFSVFTHGFCDHSDGLSGRAWPLGWLQQELWGLFSPEIKINLFLLFTQHSLSWQIRIFCNVEDNASACHLCYLGFRMDHKF